MANLPETPQWEDGIYQIEVSDPVLGGPDGISNRQGKQLASRTLYLKQQVEKGGSDLAKHVAAADPHTQYAPKASPTLTGTPTAPTQVKTDNSTKLATTAHVKSVVADYAPLSSPALTGKPTAPTAAQTANDTQLANTAFVKAAIAALVASSPAALDTLNELAAALGNDPNFATTMTNALAGKQPLDNTLTALSGKSVAALLEYLGLTIGSSPGNVVTSGSTQPAYKTTLPSVGYTDLGQNGLVANADGKVDSVTKILTTLLTKSGAGGWGLGMSLGTYLGVGGTPDDLAHVLICTDGAAFSRRWYFYNNGKAVGPGGELALQDWVNTRLSTEMPVGVILAWPGATPPAGFLKCNGAGFTAAQYPKLAQVYPSLAVPDLRGEFLRGWDDGRNVDTGRTILSSQGFALQNITGDFGESTESTGQYATEFNAATGAFQKQSYLRNVMKISAFEQRQSSASVSFDASRVAQTATETRPRNIACNYIVRAA